MNAPAPATRPWPQGFFQAGLVAAFITPLLFAWYSGQVWEDYWITFRSSRHLAEGLGLVFQPGERVHTFTSPLGVLLPALAHALTGDETAALWGFRLISAAALAAAAACLLDFARAQQWSAPATAALLGLGLLQAKTVAFSANGMETAFLVLFVALAWRELARPAGPRAGWLAGAFAGLMWTRPDGFVPAVAMAGAWWLLGPRRLDEAEQRWWAAVLRGGFGGALAYLPWMAWSTWYYGSPVPHTIIAKSGLLGGLDFSTLLLAPLRCLVEPTPLDQLFQPIYSGAGWPRDVLNVARLLARGTVLLWLVPALPRAVRAASLATLGGAVYLAGIVAYPWYFAPWTLLGAVAFAGAVAAVPAAGRWAAVGRIAAASLAGASLLLTAVQAGTARVQQRIIEENLRKPIGLWLRDHARTGDRVFLEPLGYIGYYSGLKMLDYPGLSAPEVSRLVRSGQRGYGDLIATLQPEWLVLRPDEIRRERLDGASPLRDYTLVRVWSQREAVVAAAGLPGLNWLIADMEFAVYRRKSAAP